MSMIDKESAEHLVSVLAGGKCPFHLAAALVIEEDCRGAATVSCPLCMTILDAVHFIAVARGIHVTEACQVINDFAGVVMAMPPPRPDPPCHFTIIHSDAAGEIDTGAVDYWQGRGLALATLEAFGAGTCEGLPAVPVFAPDGHRCGILQRNPEFPTDQTNHPKAYPEKYMERGSVRSQLFGVPQARALGLPYRALVEGVVDAMRCWEAGIPALAIMGNIITRQQVLHLFNEAELLVTIPDADTMGANLDRSRMFRVYVHPFLPVHRITLPDGTDPGSTTPATLAALVQDTLPPTPQPKEPS